MNIPGVVALITAKDIPPDGRKTYMWDGHNNMEIFPEKTARFACYNGFMLLKFGTISDQLLWPNACCGGCN